MTTLAPSPLPDATLLRTYAGTRSHAAFAKLLHRHLPAVYAHARRRLRDPHHAEDIAQTVFLLLAQKAHTIAPNTPLVGWLHKVTHFACANAQLAAARRARREQEAARMHPTSTEPTPIADIEPYIDRVLAALPATDRDALLLRYTEDRSLPEIAATLHLSEAATKKRLQRALDKLRTRLAAAGIMPPRQFEPTLLLAPALPAHLATTILHTTAAPTLATLHHTALLSKSLAAAKIKTIAVAATLSTTATVGIAAISLHHSTPPSLPAAPLIDVALPATPPPATAPTYQPAPDDTPDPVTIHGLVLDPADHPVRNVTVFIPALTSWNDRFTPHAPAAHTTTDSTGHFLLTYHKADVSAFSDGTGQDASAYWKSTKILATAPSFGIAWKQWNHIDPTGNLTLHLTPDTLTLDGQILTNTGQPAVGATISVDSLTNGDNLDEINKAFAAGPEQTADLFLDHPFAAPTTPPIVTDATGHFHITGLGDHRHVILLLHGPGIAAARVEAFTTPLAAPQIRYVDQPRGDRDKFTIYGNTFTYTAHSSASVEGTLRDALTDRPVPDVVVQSYRLAGPFQGFDPKGVVATTTDAAGHYSLDGFPLGEGNELAILPNDQQPYFVRIIPLPAPAQSHVTLDIDLHTGVVLTGKVTDKRTGKPLAARVTATTLLDNPHTFEFPEFQHNAGYGSHDEIDIHNATRPDGSYRLVTVPGTAIIAVYDYSGRYIHAHLADIPAVGSRNIVAERLYQPFFGDLANALRQFEIPDNATTAAADFQLDPGATIHVHPGDARNHAVPTGEIAGNTPLRYGEYVPQPFKDATADVSALASDDSRAVVIYNADRSLAVVRTVSADDPSDLPIQLLPVAHITGRCLDTKGKPLANLPITPTAGTPLPGTTTDADGRFDCTVPAADLELTVFAGPYAGTSFTSISIDPGHHQDLGDLHLHAPRRR